MDSQLRMSHVDCSTCTSALTLSVITRAGRPATLADAGASRHALLAPTRCRLLGRRHCLPQAAPVSGGAGQAVIDVDPGRRDTQCGQAVVLGGEVLLVGGAAYPMRSAAMAHLLCEARPPRRGGSGSGRSRYQHGTPMTWLRKAHPPAGTTAETDCVRAGCRGQERQLRPRAARRRAGLIVPGRPVSCGNESSSRIRSGRRVGSLAHSRGV